MSKQLEHMGFGGKRWIIRRKVNMRCINGGEGVERVWC